MKILFWNIRSINTQNSFDNLMDLNRRYHYSFVALIDSFQDPSQCTIRKTNQDIDMQELTVKKWYFWREKWEVINVLDSTQQVTTMFRYNNMYFFITGVYAKCNALERIELQKELQGINNDCSCPWIIGGDFNVILYKEEKFGGLAFEKNEATNFAFNINNCTLLELKIMRYRYTWWYGSVMAPSLGALILERLAKKWHDLQSTR